jgi:hypothetical protein
VDDAALFLSEANSMRHYRCQRLRWWGAVCIESRSDRVQPLNLLGSLVDKQLVWRSEDVEGNVRFGPLQTIRTFAFERLVENGELAESWRQHAGWCVALGEQAEAELDSPAQPAMR